MPLVGVGFAAVAALCWGIAPIFQKQALKNMTPVEVNVARGTGVVLLLIPILLFGGTDGLVLDGRLYFFLFLMALFNNIVGDIFMFVAIRRIGVSLASPITSSYPLWVAMLSWLFLGEQLTARVAAGTFLVVTGLVFLNMRKATDGCFSYAGVAAALVAAFCWATGLTLNKYLVMQGASAYAVTVWRGVFFWLAGLVCFFVVETRRPEGGVRILKAPLNAWLAGFGAGIGSLLIGGWCFATALRFIPVSVATPVSSSSPLIAAFFATLIMGEKLRAVQWFGIVFVVAGAVTVTL